MSLIRTVGRATSKKRIAPGNRVGRVWIPWQWTVLGGALAILAVASPTVGQVLIVGSSWT